MPSSAAIWYKGRSGRNLEGAILKTLKPERTADLVVRHIEDLILEGALRAGDPLLPERELAERLNVSRPTLRDGLKILEERGILVSEGRRGLRVARIGSASIADPLIALLSERAEVVDDYLEFRAVVESAAAAMAATRANDIDLERIRDCLQRIDMAHDRDDPGEEAEADIEFHFAIFEACHNLVILQIMQALSSSLRSDVLHNRGRLFSIPCIRDLLREQHRAIGEAIRARDPDRARESAQAHLAYIRNATREIREAEANLDVSLRRLAGGGISARAPGK